MLDRSNHHTRMAKIAAGASPPKSKKYGHIKEGFSFPKAVHVPGIPIDDMPAELARVANHWKVVADYVMHMYHAEASFLDIDPTYGPKRDHNRQLREPLLTHVKRHRGNFLRSFAFLAHFFVHMLDDRHRLLAMLTTLVA